MATITIKGEIADAEHLRDLAFAASRRFASRDRWEYWEDNSTEGLTFRFQESGAALAFAASCARLGLQIKCQL
jgi:hypothetical protein